MNDETRLEYAVRLAQALAFKFDYSEDKNYADLAKLAFKAVDALIAESGIKKEVTK